ncbi:MAG TPA: hypothetical protein VFQ05_16740 [Candidatus Eisenbacteria bacterium]|nr:hypothetical protein [Candidatus Eisenbacteria bacterium]
MTTELQAVIDRLDQVERQARGWKLLVVVSILIAAASIALPILYPMSASTPSSERARYSVVEANRFLLRDGDGVLAGGMEVTPDGTIRFVLGNRTTAAAFLEVQRNGAGNLTLRGPDGDVRAALLATETPSMILSAIRGVSGAALTTTANGAGQMALKDGTGRTRFRAP